MHIISVIQADQILPENKTIKDCISCIIFQLILSAKKHTGLCLEVLIGEDRFAPCPLMWNRNKNHCSAGTSNVQSPEEWSCCQDKVKQHLTSTSRLILGRRPQVTIYQFRWVNWSKVPIKKVSQNNPILKHDSYGFGLKPLTFSR